MNNLPQNLRQLYFEVVNFMRDCGGSYRHIDEKTYLNIADCLNCGRYIIRWKQGRIQRVMLFWLVRQEDLEQVRMGLAPEDRDSGTCLYISEHAGVDGVKGLRAAISELKGKYGYGCWHDRWLRPDRFREFRRDT